MFYRIVRAIHDMELQRNTHHVFRIMYHFVWIPKYRRKVFTEPYRTALKSVIEQIGYDYNIEIVELEVPDPEIKKKYFWGGKLWTQSYFVETIGNANEEVIRAYVKNQLINMDKVEVKSKKLKLF